MLKHMFNVFIAIGPADTRCCLDEDAGFTSANMMDPRASKHYFCLYFARGCCHLGSECSFLHSIPQDKDEKRFDGIKNYSSIWIASLKLFCLS